MTSPALVGDTNSARVLTEDVTRSALNGQTVAVGVTGSVAAIRVPELVAGLQARGAETLLVATGNGLRFLGQVVLPTTWSMQRAPTEELVGFFGARGVRLYTDDDEWQSWRRLGDPVLHIEIRRQANVLLIAPASANSLAKLAHGLCDNLLLSVARAWDLGEKPLLVAPAMNTAMWTHPVTAEHLQMLANRGVQVVEPVVKPLACGETGMGAMASVDALIRAVEAQIGARSPVKTDHEPTH
ncbi:hypothetical protein F1559_004358 [Cyanidiococcus yangmingshanensis]|uniref:Flavoprotein domain-containing protein n=1 Tax=Cyanidiococcus yangmingshanensis TaxID=2690220 RepID=A0A7J7IMD2_9RHOD|nr:hypothetical protein F1559_004358 [Cyanidiococcus yangmingshanensis]